jgi:hypothetical protein
MTRTTVVLTLGLGTAVVNVLMLIGILAFGYGSAKQIYEFNPLGHEELRYSLPAGIGGIMLVVPLVFRHETTIAFVFALLGKWIQGAATAHSLRRWLARVTPDRSRAIVAVITNPGVVTVLVTAYVLGLFGLWLASVGVTGGLFQLPARYDPQFGWNVVTAVSGFLSLLSTFFRVDTDADLLSPSLVVPLFLLVSLPGLYSFGLGVDITSVVLGGVVYFGVVSLGAFQRLPN